jgi:hypothetical protein
MQLIFLACLTEKFHCAYSPYAPIEINLALTQKILAQHEQILDTFFLSEIGCIERKNRLTLLSL